MATLLARRIWLLRLFPVLATMVPAAALGQQPCRFEAPGLAWTIPHRSSAGGPLTLDPGSAQWSDAGSTSISKDCSMQLDYPDLKTEVRGFWTDSSVYFLFASPYRELNLFLPAQGEGDRDKLWDRDVVELFLGADWKNIFQYREFEIAPTGDRVDLAIDLERKQYDQAWQSGWTTGARIDRKTRTWYAAAQIPLAAVSPTPVKVGSRWRVNFYRIDGPPPDTRRRFLCWQQTCVVNRDPNHVPESFGTLEFGK